MRENKQSLEPSLKGSYTADCFVLVNFKKTDPGDEADAEDLSETVRKSPCVKTNKPRPAAKEQFVLGRLFRIGEYQKTDTSEQGLMP